MRGPSSVQIAAAGVNDLHDCYRFASVEIRLGVCSATGMQTDKTSVAAKKGILIEPSCRSNLDLEILPATPAHAQLKLFDEKSVMLSLSKQSLLD